MDREASEAASRYAQALFDLAKEAGALDALDRDLRTFMGAWAESSDLRAVATSPLIEPEEKARGMTAVAQRLGVSDLGRKLIGVAAMNRRAAELPAITSVFRALLTRERGARHVSIVSARPMAEAQKAAILDALARKLGAKIEAEMRIDESLIGGFVVRVGSRQFDASVKAKLDALRLQLKTA